MRILIAGIIGGILMFLWGGVSHTMLGVGEMGFKPVPNEAAVISNLKSNLSEPGMYFLPGMDMSRTITPEEQAAWMAKYKEGPTAVIVYNPTGITPFSPQQIIIELLSNILSAMIVALMFSWLVPSFTKRVLFATLFGLGAWLSIDVSYWDWYRFPSAFVTGELIEQVVGWFIVGLVMALIVRGKRLGTSLAI
jgi:hypothetical protein